MTNSENTTLPAETMPCEWRCFHCGEVFTDWLRARNHFGYTPEDGAPVCRVDGGTAATIYHLKRQVEVLQRRQAEEDTELHREIARLKSEHATALRREEEKGYERGLRDAQKYPETIGLAMVSA